MARAAPLHNRKKGLTFRQPLLFAVNKFPRCTATPSGRNGGRYPPRAPRRFLTKKLRQKWHEIPQFLCQNSQSFVPLIERLYTRPIETGLLYIPCFFSTASIRHLTFTYRCGRVAESQHTQYMPHSNTRIQYVVGGG